MPAVMVCIILAGDLERTLVHVSWMQRLKWNSPSLTELDPIPSSLLGFAMAELRESSKGVC